MWIKRVGNYQQERIRVLKKKSKAIMKRNGIWVEFRQREETWLFEDNTGKGCLRKGLCRPGRNVWDVTEMEEC